MKNLPNELLAGGVAVVVAILSLFLLDLRLPIVIFLTLGCFGGTWFLLPRRKHTEIVAEENNKASVSEGREKLNEIISLAQHLRKTSMVERVKEVCVSINKILVAVSEDPTKLKQAEQFLGYYLDSTIKILTMYIEIGSKGIQDAEVMNSLSNVENTFIILKEAFDKQLTKLLTNDVMNLDAELNLLRQTINMEGLGK